MTQVLIDPYRPGASRLHRLDPRARILLGIGFILTAALLSPGAWGAYVLLFSLTLSAALACGLGIPWMLRRSLLALPVAVVALPLLFTESGVALAHFELGFASLAVTQAGLVRFISVVMKTWLSFQAALLLAALSPFNEILRALGALGVPRLLVALMAMMWRYLFVLAGTAARLLQARAARSADPQEPTGRRGGGLAWRARVVGGMSGTLLLRSFERAERIHAAMLARGFDGEIRGLPLPRFHLSGFFSVLGGWVVYSLILLFGYLTH